MTVPPFLQSSLLAGLPGVRHAFFTRNGGVSKGIYTSLNLGRGSRDDPAAVETNRARAAGVFGVESDHLITAYQIHSATAHVAVAPWTEPPQGDAIATTMPGLALGALAADCAPILLADAKARVVASAHAGWQGALAGVAEAAIEAMVGLGAVRERIVAVVGPCIGQASYEVGLEFLERFETAQPSSARFFAAGASPDKRQFDLPGFVLDRLRGAGVADCAWIGRDTCAEPGEFFSNRRAVKTGEDGYGRLMAAIMLEPEG
jgi:YfiH family protein